MKEPVSPAISWSASIPGAGQQAVFSCTAQTSFEFVLRRPYAGLLCSWGPKAKRAWAGECWSRQFICSQPV